MKKLKHSSFKSIRVLVIVFIITLSATFLIHSGFSSRQLDLRSSARKLAQDLREAGEMAMLVKEFEDLIPPGGYGVHFNLSNPTSYLLFADNGNYYFDGQLSEDKVVKEVELESKLKITELKIGENRYKREVPLDIVFTPPDPKVTITSDQNQAAIVLQDEETNETVTVFINSIGLVEVE
jgi:hypothetical protein